MHPLKVVRFMTRLTKLVTGFLNFIQLTFCLLFAIPIAVVAAVSVVALVLDDTGELIPAVEDSGISRYFPQCQRPMSCLTFSSAFFMSDLRSSSSRCSGCVSIADSVFQSITGVKISFTGEVSATATGGSTVCD